MTQNLNFHCQLILYSAAIYPLTSPLSKYHMPTIKVRPAIIVYCMLSLIALSSPRYTLSESSLPQTGILLPYAIEDNREVQTLTESFANLESMDIRSWEFQVGDIWLLVYSTRWDALLIAYDSKQERVIFSEQEFSRGVGEDVRLYKKEGISPDAILTLDIESGSGTGLYHNSFLIYSIHNNHLVKLYEEELNGYSDNCSNYRKYDFQYEVTPGKNKRWQIRKFGREVLLHCPEGTDCSTCYALTDGIETVVQTDTSLLLSAIKPFTPTVRHSFLNLL